MMDDRSNGRNGQRPPTGYGGDFLHVWSPFFINLGIGIGIALIASVVLGKLYMSAHAKEVAAALENREAMSELFLRMSENLVRYTTQIEGVTSLVTIPIMAFLYYKDRKRDEFYGVAPNKKAPAGKYIMVVIMAVALNIALNNLIIIGNLSSYSVSYEQTAKALYAAPLGVQILCLGILAPVAEELVFRGLMYRRMRENTGFVASMIYSAVIFGMIHGNLVQIIFGAAMGIMLAYVYEKYGSILAPFTAHIAVNVISILATYFNIYDWMVSRIMVMGAITVACAAAAAIMFQIMQQIDEKPEITEEN